MTNKMTVPLQLIAVVIAGHFLAYQICHVPKQMELVAIVGIILLYPIIRFPSIGMYVFFFISPFIPYIRRLYYLAYGRPGTDPLIIIGDIIIFLIFAGLYFRFKEHRPGNAIPTLYVPAIACYLVYLIIRTFVFNISPISDNIAKLKYYAPAVLLFFVGVLYSREYVCIRRLWLLTIVISFLASLYGLKQLFLGYSGAEKLWFASIKFTTLFIKGIARPFSFFQSPAAFADFLLLGIIGVLMFHSWTTVKGKQLFALLVPLFFYCILITSVRSNWIGAGAVFICWFIIFKMKNNIHRIVVIALAALFVFGYQFVDDSIKADIGLAGINKIMGGKLGRQEYIDLMVTSRAKAITNPFEEHSMLSRIALWKYMFILSMDPEMAIAGRGLGTLNADSLYITYLAEFGYPGFIFIIAVFCAFIIRGIRMIDTLSDPRAVILAKGIVCMDLSLALMNLTGTHIHSFPGDAYFWFFNGVLMSIPALDQKLNNNRVMS